MKPLPGRKPFKEDSFSAYARFVFISPFLVESTVRGMVSFGFPWLRLTYVLSSLCVDAALPVLPTLLTDLENRHFLFDVLSPYPLLVLCFSQGGKQS